MRVISTDPDHPGFFAIGQAAVGIIAFGQAALGVIAVGQIARGVFCLGQGAIGVFCVGQGAIGLWHATGMIALAGQRGYGLALHTLPQIGAAPLPEMKPTTPLRDLTEGRAAEGWVSAKITPQGLLQLDEGPATLDASNVYEKLLDATKNGLDRAHVKLRGQQIPDAAAYREQRSHVGLRAEDVVVYSSNRPRYLAYGVPPKGKAGGPASTWAVVLRTLAFFVACAIVTVVTFIPLLEALENI